MKQVLLLGLCLSIYSANFAQEFNSTSSDSTQTTEKKSKKDKPKEDFKRVFFGAGFGLGISGSGGSLNLAPMLGYNITKRLQIGTKFTYWYMWQRISDPNNTEHKVNDNMFALGVFSRLIIWKGLYAHVEPEYMNRSSFQTNYWNGNQLTGYRLPASSRTDVFNMYVGGGFYQGMTGNSGMFIQLLWNLNQTNDSYYANPYLQIGFAF